MIKKYLAISGIMITGMVICITVLIISKICNTLEMSTAAQFPFSAYNLYEYNISFYSANAAIYYRYEYNICSISSLINMIDIYTAM